MCGNKIDLNEKRVVNNNEIDEYIKKNKLIYAECSAKNGEGIKELFNVIAKNLGESNFAKSEYVNVDFNINNNENKDQTSKSNYVINIQKDNQNEQSFENTKNKKNNNAIELHNNKDSKVKKKRCC